MSKIKHRKLQHEQDFRGVRNYRKSIPDALLESINGANHQDYLKERFQKENNYMSKKSGHKQNLMTVECLLNHIAKDANELTKRLKEAQQIIKSNFPMVQGVPSGDKCSPEFAVQVLMDCEGNAIDCDHQMYGKGQNIGLHDVISPVAMAWITACGKLTLWMESPPQSRPIMPFARSAPIPLPTIWRSITTFGCISEPYWCVGGPAATSYTCNRRKWSNIARKLMV